MPETTFTPAGLAGGLHRQEPDTCYNDRSLERLVKRAAADEELAWLLYDAWILGWKAGLADARPDSLPATACPFSKAGGWL